MPSPLRNIVSKEIKEILRDPRLFLSMVIVPLIIFPVMGMSMGAVISSTEKELENMEFSIVLVDNDQGFYSSALLSYLNGTQNMTTYVLAPGTDLNSSIQYALDNEANAIIVIPANFTSDLEAGTKTNITMHMILQSISIVESARGDYIAALLYNFESGVVVQNIMATNTTYAPDFFLDPIGLDENTVLEGQDIPYSPEQVEMFFMAQVTIVPIVLMMLIIMSAQLAAVTVASEKEEKTLETLLSLPVRRTTILMGKISGVAMMAMVGAAAYMVGFMYYMNSMTNMGGGASIGAEELGLSIDPLAVAVLAISLILALLAALSLAVLLAAFTEDVRSAQSLTGIIVLPAIIPMFILMVGDLSTLPGSIQALVYAIPFSYPTLAAKSLFTGAESVLFFGIAYQLAFTLATFYAAGRLFSTEKIFTAKLRFKRKR